MYKPFSPEIFYLKNVSCFLFNFIPMSCLFLIGFYAFQTTFLFDLLLAHIGITAELQIQILVVYVKERTIVNKIHVFSNRTDVANIMPESYMHVALLCGFQKVRIYMVVKRRSHSLVQ